MKSVLSSMRTLDTGSVFRTSERETLLAHTRKLNANDAKQTKRSVSYR